MATSPSPDPLPAGAAGEPQTAASTGAGTETERDGATAAKAAHPGTGFAPPASSAPTPAGDAAIQAERPRKGPLSFLSGALTSGLLAWLCLGLSQRVVAYYGEHPPHYSAQIAQSIATALKTLIVGMCFLATFSFAFIGLGLALTFVRSLLPAGTPRQTS